MKAVDKLRVTWNKKEKTCSYHYPAGSQTSADAAYLAGIITDEVARELRERGYDPSTMKFSIEPRKGNRDFDSQLKNRGEERK